MSTPPGLAVPAEVRKRKFTTDSSSEVQNLLWTISNFRARVDSIEPLKSVVLDFDAGETIQMPTKWRFYFYMDKVTDGKLGIFLKLIDSPKNIEKVYAAFNIALKNGTGSVKNLELKICEWKKTNVELGFTEAISPLDAFCTNGLIDGCLVMDIKFELFSFGKTSEEDSSPRNKFMKLHNQSRKLMFDNIQKVIDRTNSTPKVDFKIVMKDGKEFPVHKTILASGSPTMFNSGTGEVSSGKVKVDDLSSDTMEIVLKFIYSGKMDEKWKQRVEEIVYAAEKYSLTLLKEYCNSMMLDVVTPKNSIDLLKLARKFKLKTAEKEILEYVSKNLTKVFDATILI